MSPIQNIRNYAYSAVLALWGCGTLVGNPEEETTSSHSSVDAPSQIVTFNMADAPVDDAVSVFVTVQSVEIKPENGDWTMVPLLFSQEIDLLQYQDGASIAFAQTGVVSEGVYLDTRMMLSQDQPPRIVLTDGSEKLLQVNEVASVISLGKPFTVAKDLPVDVTFDFDLRKSLLVTGEGSSREYELAPVVRMVKSGEFGDIVGEATDGNVVCVYPVEIEMDDSDRCEHAVNSAKVKNGKYKLPFMPKGSYKVRVFDKLGKIKNAETEKNAHEVVPKEYKGKKTEPSNEAEDDKIEESFKQEDKTEAESENKYDSKKYGGKKR